MQDEFVGRLKDLYLSETDFEIYVDGELVYDSRIYLKSVIGDFLKRYESNEKPGDRFYFVKKIGRFSTNLNVRWAVAAGDDVWIMPSEVMYKSDGQSKNYMVEIIDVDACKKTIRQDWMTKPQEEIIDYICNLKSQAKSSAKKYMVLQEQQQTEKEKCQKLRETVKGIIFLVIFFSFILLIGVLTNF